MVHIHQPIVTGPECTRLQPVLIQKSLEDVLYTCLYKQVRTRIHNKNQPRGWSQNSFSCSSAWTVMTGAPEVLFMSCNQQNISNWSLWKMVSLLMTEYTFGLKMYVNSIYN